MNNKKNMIAIDLGGTSIRGVVINENNEIMHRIKQDTVRDSTDALMQQITQLIHSLEKLEHDHISRIGICVAGSVNHEKGVLIKTPNLPLTKKKENDEHTEFPLKSKLESSVSIPISIGSEIKMAALGELYSGKAKGKYKDVVVLTIGTGVGAGVIINGKLYHGATYIAGEMGHTIVENEDSGFECGCGRKGHIEAYCAGPSLEKRMKDKSKKELKPPAILEMYKNNDPNAVAALKETAKYIGICISNIKMYYDPEIIVLRGGFILNAWHHIKKEVIDTIEHRIIVSRKTLKEPVRHKIEQTIKLTELGDDGALYGIAALMACEDFHRE